MRMEMLLLEIGIVLLLLGEVFIRLRRRLKKHHRRENVSTVAKAAPPTPASAETVRDTPAVTTAQPAVSLDTAVVLQETMDMQDLLREAEIYLTYGHHAQAATVLRWYVDMHPQDSRAINRLLDTYTAMADMESYASLLEQLGEKPRAATMDASWWQQRIQEGLQQDPGNLELLVLAEKVGMSVPVPASEADTPAMTAKMALTLVSRNPDPHYGMAILWRAITHDPLHLALYAEWLRITHQPALIEAYINGVILLFLALGTGGQTLRARVLRAGKDLGPHPLWETLSAGSGNLAELRRLAQSRHLEIPALLQKHTGGDGIS